MYSLNEPSDSSDIVSFIPDPVRCPVTGMIDDCLIVVPLTTGGNPNLQPETSTQWNVGIAWEPLPKLSIGVDYWSIEQNGVITAVDPEYIVANEGQFPGRVIRGPVDPAYPSLPGPIVAVDGSLINIGKTQTSGLDVAIRWRSAATEAGTFDVGLQGTYVRQFDTQFDGVTTLSLLGDATSGTPVPRWRSTLTVDWSKAHGARRCRSAMPPATWSGSIRAPPPARSMRLRVGTCRGGTRVGWAGRLPPASATCSTASRRFR